MAGVDEDHVNDGGVGTSQSSSASRAPCHWARRSLGRLNGTAILVQRGSGSCRRKAVFSIILAQIKVLELRG